jgi:hypothetical protein
MRTEGRRPGFSPGFIPCVAASNTMLYNQMNTLCSIC